MGGGRDIVKDIIYLHLLQTGVFVICNGFPCPYMYRSAQVIRQDSSDFGKRLVDQSLDLLMRWSPIAHDEETNGKIEFFGDRMVTTVLLTTIDW